jgi:hypothetical protein
MTLERSHSANHRLVFSLMFTSWSGPLMRQCDLMIEDGEILARLLDDDLGEKPSDATIEQSVDAVIEFVAECKDPVLRALPDE